MRQALLISIWQLCAIFTSLFTSQALSSWIGADTHFPVSPEIFDWVQAQTLAGPLKDVQRVVCFGSLSCWKVNLLPSLRFWMLWTGFSLRQYQYFGALSFSVPAAENSYTARGCYQHTLLLGWYSAGDEQNWFTSNMMLGIEVHQTRESCFSESEGPLKFQVCFHVSYLKRGLSLATPP